MPRHPQTFAAVDKTTQYFVDMVRSRASCHFLTCLNPIRDMSEFNDFERQFLDFFCDAAGSCYAQFGQDIWAYWALQGLTDGTFIDIGATDGWTNSNTYLLERLGWAGVLVEPRFDVAEALRKNRVSPIDTRCVWRVSDEVVPFIYVPDKPDLSGIRHGDTEVENETDTRRAVHETIEIPTVSLNDLWETHKLPDTVDFVSIDTEGSELEILNGFDFARRHVRAFAIEHNGGERRSGIRELLERHGYRALFQNVSYVDDWFVDEEVASKLSAGTPSLPDLERLCHNTEYRAPAPPSCSARLHVARLLESTITPDKEADTTDTNKQEHILALLDDAVAIAPNLALPRIRRAERFLADGSVARAIECLAAGLREIDPSEDDARDRIALRLNRVGYQHTDSAVVLETLDRILDLHPELAAPMVAKGLAHQKAGDLSRARETLTGAIQQFPSELCAHTGFAQMLRAQGRSKAAAMVLWRAWDRPVLSDASAQRLQPVLQNYLIAAQKLKIGGREGQGPETKLRSKIEADELLDTAILGWLNSDAYIDALRFETYWQGQGDASTGKAIYAWLTERGTATLMRGSTDANRIASRASEATDIVLWNVALNSVVFGSSSEQLLSSRRAAWMRLSSQTGATHMDSLHMLRDHGYAVLAERGPVAARGNTVGSAGLLLAARADVAAHARRSFKLDRMAFNQI